MQNYAFCTLALGQRYCLYTRALAADIQNYLPGVALVVGTDHPEAFADLAHVHAFRHQKTGILHCYHDKRFVLARTLVDYPSAIFIDADTRLLQSPAQSLTWSPGITAGHIVNVIQHLERYNPARLVAIRKVAAKLALSLESAQFVGESMFVLTREEGKEQEFLRYWGKIGRYLELQGIHSGEGATIGLAALKAGLKIQHDPSWDALNQARQHLDATGQANAEPVPAWRQFLSKWERRRQFHSRLALARLVACRDFEFYYR